MVVVKQRPLLLKDYLEEDQNLDTVCGFASTYQKWGETTVRYLLDSELRDRGDRDRPTGLRRSRSKGISLTRISTFLNAVKMLAAATSFPRGPKQGALRRSFSKRLLPKSFWRRRCSYSQRGEGDNDCIQSVHDGVCEGKVLLKDFIRLESIADEKHGGKVVFSPSRQSPPVVSSRNSCSCSTSAWSENDSSSGYDSVRSMSSPLPAFAAEPNSSPAKKRPNELSSSPSRAVDVISMASHCDETKDGIQRPEEGHCVSTCHEYEDKEQLSPVSVMDFPYDDEEETASVTVVTSPTFHQSIASFERTTQELLKKIRRFESLAQLVDPVDLDEAFSDEHEVDLVECDELDDQDFGIKNLVRARAREVLDRFILSCSAGTLEANSRRLLLDFFSQGLYDSWSGEVTWHEADRTVAEGLLLGTAREWAEGIHPNDVASREGLMCEMDMSGQWRCVNEVDTDICADLELEVLGSLLEELLFEMFLD